MTLDHIVLKHRKKGIAIQDGTNHDCQQLKQFAEIYVEVVCLLDTKLGKACTCDKMPPPQKKIYTYNSSLETG